MTKPSSLHPAWRPENAGPEYAARIVPGGGRSAAKTKSPPRRRRLSPEEYAAGVLGGDRALLAQTITVVESDATARITEAQAVLARLLPHAGRAVRIGITGVPGAGKSSLIEAWGTQLCGQGRRVAVLAVDPSSSVSRGSILGDKTRMEQLAREPNAFIRPSPSGGALGGVARKTRETILVCEAAGYEIILVETVGVGQSEIAVRSMVDFLLLLTITGGGDDLQGMKRGALELADAVCVTKADGANAAAAEATRRQLQESLHYLAPATPGWPARALACSARTGEGIPALGRTVEEFLEATRASGAFAERRRRQNLAWARTMLEEALRDDFFRQPAVAARRAEWERAILDGSIPVTAAVRELLALGGK
ncbi:MAG TPA: methylmalonyl Co-A mutase-associated GTPase MeaB [Opitutaceae bacterium]|nr:methylmalonyl Co-A mutase-associated GTPase MeaB [Opitutaceae bacterium]